MTGKSLLGDGEKKKIHDCLENARNQCETNKIIK
jgi:hypothetical protein